MVEQTRVDEVSDAIIARAAALRSSAMKLPAVAFEKQQMLDTADCIEIDAEVSFAVASVLVAFQMSSQGLHDSDVGTPFRRSFLRQVREIVLELIPHDEGNMNAYLSAINGDTDDIIRGKR